MDEPYARTCDASRAGCKRPRTSLNSPAALGLGDTPASRRAWGGQRTVLVGHDIVEQIDPRDNGVDGRLGLHGLRARVCSGEGIHERVEG